jgi:tetratricopeptide (TPR) repeat protein
MLAQSAPPSCPAELPVDDIIAEIHKQQTKKKRRNTNPLPDSICIGAWCHGYPMTPPTIPIPAPRSERPNDQNTSSSSESSSKNPTNSKSECDERMDKALEAAHNVDVGDYYFEEKRNYNAALMRYRDALEAKPGDIAIHVRLGRVFEKLNQPPQAVEQYQAAQKLPGPQKWSDEAKSALLRLQHPPGL